MLNVEGKNEDTLVDLLIVKIDNGLMPDGLAATLTSDLGQPSGGIDEALCTIVCIIYSCTHIGDMRCL
jgi:hypothetical protein